VAQDPPVDRDSPIPLLMTPALWCEFASALEGNG
jgi:hypothetical protein